MRTRTQKFSTPLTAVRVGAAGSVNETRPLLVRACVSSVGEDFPAAGSETTALLSDVNSDVNSDAQPRPSQHSHASLTTGRGYSSPVAGLVLGRVTSNCNVTFAPPAEKASDCARESASPARGLSPQGKKLLLVSRGA